MANFKVFLTETIESFLVTLGYGFVFYLLIKKLQKSWPTLIISVAIFSLIVLSFWWVALGVMSTEDATGDITGIYLAIAALCLLFHFNSLGLKQPGEDSSLFLRPDEKKKFKHLSRLFQVSILIEERAANFYNQLAGKVAHPDIQHLSQKFAQDEIRHKEFIVRSLSSWLPLTRDHQTLALFEKELVIGGIFANPPGSEASAEEWVKYAIGQEEILAKFYLSFERAFAEQKKGMNIQSLVMEERAHANVLIASYQKLNNKSK